MIALLLSSLLSLFLFIAFGFYFTKFIKVPTVFVEKLLIGLVVCNTLATCISLFFPINIFVLLFLISLGLFFLIIIKKELKTYFLSLYVKKYIIFCSLTFILIAFLISLSSIDNYDTGLYHLQAIKWIEEYSVVPGLANLHGRFGFNPNIFTFFALTSLNDLFRQEIFSVNFTVFAILVFYFLNKLKSLLDQQGFSNLFLFYFFCFLIIIRLPNLSSPSPGFLSTAISLFIFARMLDLSGQKVNSEFRSYIPILVLSIYIVTIKLAALPILLLFVFVLIKYKSELRKSLWLLPLLSLIVIPWLARNIITTGWLVYPFPSLDLFNFDWKVSLGSVISEKEAVTGWARNPGVNYVKAANMVFIEWFPIWYQRIGFIQRVFFAMSILFPLIALISQVNKKNKIDLLTNAVIITSFLGVIFWFFLAPDWRFGQSFILIASMLPLLLLNSDLRVKLSLKFVVTGISIFLLGYYTIGKAFIVLVLMAPLLYFKSYLSPTYKTKIVFGALLFLILGSYIKRNNSKIKQCLTRKALYSNCIIVPPKIEIPPNVNFRTYKISGVNIYVPTEGDRCFDNNLPCTPYPATTLVLRKNTLKSGFKHVSINE